MTGHWTAVARSRALGRRPRRVLVDGKPLVLFRDGLRIHALADRCPHRAAPLSRGRIVDGQAAGALLECPYHGWRFDGSGRCRAMPGLASEAFPRVAVPTRAAREVGGLVFVADSASSGEPRHEPYVCALPPEDRVAIIVESRVAARLVDVAENILDATHTHFTHKGLLRGLSGARRRIEVSVTAGEDWVEARYEGEPRQDGLISRLLEGGRTTSIGRFIRPGIAELEFRGPRGINLTTTFHLREEQPGVTHGFAILAGPRQRGLGYLKAALFLPLFRIALGQDRRILEACARNREAHAGAAPMVAPLDVLRPHIASLIAGRTPRIETPTIVMEL